MRNQGRVAAASMILRPYARIVRMVDQRQAETEPTAPDPVYNFHRHLPALDPVHASDRDCGGTPLLP